MYICMYVRMHVCRYVCRYVLLICACMYCMHARLDACNSERAITCIYRYMCIYICIRIYLCVYIHSYIYIHIYMYTIGCTLRVTQYTFYIVYIYLHTHM